MKNTKFKNLLNKIQTLNNYQFRLVREEVDVRVKKKRVSNILETPKNQLLCPHCKSNMYIRWGKRNDLQRYKCKSCAKTFNSLTNTPLARLRRKGHWLQYANCLKEGLTVRKAANICSIHKNTSFRWRHRFLKNSIKIKSKKLSGIIESSDLVFKESFKGQKLNKILENRRDVFVIYGIDRNNNIFDITDKGNTKETFEKGLDGIIKKDSLLYSSELKELQNYTQYNQFKHIVVKNNKHSLSNINNVENYKLKFEKWIRGHFRGVATKYLENYVSWYRGLNEFNSGIRSLTLLYRAKAIEKYRHQPLKVTWYV